MSHATLKRRQISHVLQLAGALEAITLTLHQDAEAGLVGQLDTHHKRGLVAGSRLLADELHAQLVTAVEEWEEPDWFDRKDHPTRGGLQHENCF